MQKINRLKYVESYPNSPAIYLERPISFPSAKNLFICGKIEVSKLILFPRIIFFPGFNILVKLIPKIPVVSSNL